MTTIARPWKMVVDNTSVQGGVPSVTSGVVNDFISDTRSPLIKTPKGPWRMPTNYSRVIETGSTHTYNSSCLDTYGFNGYPPEKRGLISAYGAQNANGFYYVAVPTIPAGVENDLILKARSKVKAMHVNLAQAFAERDQTTRLVSQSLIRIANIVRNVYGAKRHFNARYFRYLKNKWHNEDFFNYFLELQYGWKPLLSDCYGAVEALKKREEEMSARGIVTVKAGYRDNVTDYTVLNGQWNTCKYSFTRARRIEHKAFIRLDFKQSNSVQNGTLAQLGITNPLNIAWELMPWSFVADWFVPVGAYLDSLDATLGWDFVGGSFSSKSTCKVRAINASLTTFPATYNNRKSWVKVDGEGRQMRFNRKAYTTAPMPTRPSLTKLNKSSHAHVANGIALLMSLITGGTKVR